MFILKKMLAPFLLPPGIFMVILIFSGVWFLFRKNWKAGIVNFLIGCLMWTLSISPVANAVLRGLESDLAIPKNPKGDVIILLGGGVYGGSPDLSGVGSPSETMLARLVTAVRLQRILNIPIIVAGGKVFEHGTVEAPIVRRFLIDLGVSPNEIFTEERSRDTFENAKYTQEICARFGYKSPILVTSAFHMKRSIMNFKKAGLEVVPFPAGFQSLEGRQYRWNDYLPGTFKNLSTAIREYLGLAFYTLAY